MGVPSRCAIGTHSSTRSAGLRPACRLRSAFQAGDAIRTYGLTRLSGLRPACRVKLAFHAVQAVFLC